MSKWLLLGMAAVGFGAARLTNPPVELQASSPGTQQAGNANLSGTLRAGSVSATDSAANAQVVSGLASSPTGATYSGLFRNASTTGRAVRGYSTAASGSGVGGDFQADAPSGMAVKAIVPSATGTNYAVYGKTNSPDGYAGFFVGRVRAQGDLNVSGNLEVNGTKAGIPGGAFYALGNADGVYGFGSVGCQGVGNGTSGIGCYGSVADTSGSTLGGYFLAYSGDGIGVSGLNFASSGFAQGGRFEAVSPDGRGVIGFASATSGSTYGIRGTASSPNGYGVYSAGNFGCSGNKQFRIDHPFDPANKYLIHYSAEGPRPLLIYDGLVRTDAKGFAWVTLPDYFAEINKEPRYQLTVIDSSQDFVMAKVTREIEGNRFQIRTSKPGVRVSWEVKGIRNDAWNQAHGAPVEVEKTGAEKGLYQHPELYGQPAEKGIDYRAPVGPLAPGSK